MSLSFGSNEFYYLDDNIGCDVTIDSSSPCLGSIEHDEDEGIDINDKFNGNHFNDESIEIPCPMEWNTFDNLMPSQDELEENDNDEPEEDNIDSRRIETKRRSTSTETSSSSGCCLSDVEPSPSSPSSPNSSEGYHSLTLSPSTSSSSSSSSILHHQIEAEAEIEVEAETEIQVELQAEIDHEEDDEEAQVDMIKESLLKEGLMNHNSNYVDASFDDESIDGFKDSYSFLTGEDGSGSKLDEDISNDCTNKTEGNLNDDNNSGGSFYCKWTNCDWPGNYDDLVDHIREIHVELQPYQQQKHNWTEVMRKNHEDNKKKKNHNHDDGPNVKNTKQKVEDNEITSCSTSSKAKKKIKHDATESTTCSSSVCIDTTESCCPKAKKRLKLNHNQESKSQQYVCLWEGCKVYGKASLSRNWLERHVLQHSGPRPFKCIVQNCRARFKIQSALERHVNSHFKPNLEFNCTNSNQESTNEIFINNKVDASSLPSTSTSFAGSIASLSSSLNSLGASAGAYNANSTNPNPSYSSLITSTFHATMMRAKSLDANTNTSSTPNKILKRKKSSNKLRRKCFVGKLINGSTLYNQINFVLFCS